MTLNDPCAAIRVAPRASMRHEFGTNAARTIRRRFILAVCFGTRSILFKRGIKTSQIRVNVLPLEGDGDEDLLSGRANITNPVSGAKLHGPGVGLRLLVVIFAAAAFHAGSVGVPVLA